MQKNTKRLPPPLVLTPPGFLVNAKIRTSKGEGL